MALNAPRKIATSRGSVTDKARICLKLCLVSLGFPVFSLDVPGFAGFFPPERVAWKPTIAKSQCSKLYNWSVRRTLLHAECLGVQHSGVIFNKLFIESKRETGVGTHAMQMSRNQLASHFLSHSSEKRDDGNFVAKFSYFLAEMKVKFDF